MKIRDLILGGSTLWRTYFRNPKSSLGSCGYGTAIARPVVIRNPENVYFGSHVSIGPYAFISATNAKLTIKDNVIIAQKLTALTGNHARVPGLLIKQVTEANKPNGYDKRL